MGFFDTPTENPSAPTSGKTSGFFDTPVSKPSFFSDASSASPSAPVQNSVEKIFNSVKDTLGNYIKNPLGTEINAVKNVADKVNNFLESLPGKSMDFPVITGPTPEVLNKQAKDLKDSEKTINYQDPAAIKDYNTRIDQFNQNINQYNTANKTQQILSKKNTATQYTPLQGLSHDLSQVLNEPIKGFGEAGGNTKVFQNLAQKSDEGKAIPSFVESLANHLQYGTDVISGFTGGIIQPEHYNTDSKDANDFVSKMVGAIATGAGAVASIGGDYNFGTKASGAFKGLEGAVGMNAPKVLLENLQNYPRVAAFASGLAKTIPAFATYGQLNPNLGGLGDRVKQMGKDILLSVPYTALGLINNKAIIVPVSAALGFGLAKMEGASNKDAAISATTLGLLSLMGGGEGKKSKEIITQDQVKGELKNQAVQTINKFSDTKISANSSEKEIKQAFKEAALKTHPDVGGNEKDFSAVTYARDILIEQPKSTEAQMTGQKTPEEATQEVKDTAMRFNQKPVSTNSEEVNKLTEKEELKPLADEAKKYNTVEEFKASITPKQYRDFLNASIGENGRTASSSATGATSRKYGDYLYAQDKEAFTAHLEDVRKNINPTDHQDITDFFNQAHGIEPQFNEKGRTKLPEVPAEPKRITEYKDRLKLRGADPVLVDAIITPSGARAYGVSVGGRISLEKTVEKFTEDHEVFHQVFQNFNKMRLFKNFDKEALISEARDLYGDLPEAQLEEEMAKDFQQYVNEQENGKSTSFFGKIAEFFQKLFASIKRLFRNENDIQEFYRTMKEGNATEETVINDEMPEAFNEKIKDGVLDFRIQNDVANFLQEVPVQDTFTDSGDLTLKTITKLEGRTTVSKQFILDSTNSPGITQPERDLVRALLETEGDVVNVQEFADKVKAELLPLEIKDVGGAYENTTLPENLRGEIENYNTNVYESPIKTSAGQIHFDDVTDAMDGNDVENYFGHTRIEDIPDNKTRRIIEVQSDLYQKGRLENERISPSQELIDMEKEYAEGNISTVEFRKAEDEFYGKRNQEIIKLQQYNNPTAHFRMVREEIRRAAQDDKTKLQFPTGETAMKIEGLGGSHVFNNEPPNDTRLKIEDLEVGKTVLQGFNPWVITDVLGDGKFKAVPKDANGLFDKPVADATELAPGIYGDSRAVEEFDISGKTDTSNPIYRFYEKDLARYLKNNYNAISVTDAQGVSWMEVPIQKAYGDLPVPAFNTKQEFDEEGNPIIRYDQEETIPSGKNPAFETGNKLEDVRKTLEHVENRVGMTKSERVLDAAARAKIGESFGPRPERMIKKSAKEIKEVVDAYIKEKTKEIDVQKVPMVKVSGKDIEIPQDLLNKQFSYEMRKVIQSENPLKTLKKYEATHGEFKGMLPEVVGATRYIRNDKTGEQKIIKPAHGNKLANLFATKGDDIVNRDEFIRFADADGNISTETIREEYENYKEEKQKLKEEGIAIRDEINKFITNEKDQIALERIAGAKDQGLERQQIKEEKTENNVKEADSLQDWKNFIHTYAEEIDAPKSVEEVKPPIGRGGIQAPVLDLLKAKDNGWMARDSLDRNIEKVFTREDAVKLNEFLSDHLRENATKEVEYLDKTFKPLAEAMKKLGIKPGSDEESAVQLLGEGLVTLDDLKREFPKNWDNIQKAVPIFERMYKNALDDLNPERKKFGYDPIVPLKNYFPHIDGISFWTKYYGILNKNDDLPTSIAGKTQFFHPGKTFTRHELHRTGRKTKYAAIEGAKTYIKSIAKQMFSMDSIARGRALDRYITKSAEVGEKLGTPLKLSRFQTNLQEVIQNQLASKMGGIDREIEKFGDRKVVNAILAISKLIGKNIIAFNPSIFLTHLVSMSYNAATVDKIPFMKGMMTTVSAPFMKDSYYMIDGQRSDLLYRRYPKEYLKTKLESVDEAGGWMIKQSDIFKTRTAVASKYYELIKQGVDPKIAIKQADIYAGRIVGDYSRGLKPTLLNQKLVKVLAQFQFGMNDALSVLLHDIPYTTKKMDGKTIKLYQGKDGVYRPKQDYIKMFWKIAQWMIFAFLMNELFFKKIKGVGKGLDPIGLSLTLAGLDTEGEGQSIGKRVGLTAKDFAGELPFANVFFGNSPTASVISQIWTDFIAGNVLKGLEGVGANFISPVGGGSQIKKTLEGINAIRKGESIGTAQNIKSVLFGASQAVTPNSIISKKLDAQLKTANTKLDEYDSSMVSDMQSTYEQVQKLKDDPEKAQALVNDLSNAQYTIYKSIIAVEDAKKAIDLEPKLLPIVIKASLLTGDKKKEYIDDTFPDTREGNFELRIAKNIRSALGDTLISSADSWDKQSFITHISNIAKAAKTDPITLFNDIFVGDWKVIQLKNGQIIVDRNNKKEASEKKSLGGNSTMTLDHLKSLELGGNNSVKNMWLIPADIAKDDDQVENYLGDALKIGKITGPKAQELEVRYKKGADADYIDKRTKNIFDNVDSPLTFDEVKQMVGQ